MISDMSEAQRPLTKFKKLDLISGHVCHVPKIKTEKTDTLQLI